jgi:hypothetical protein
MICPARLWTERIEKNTLTDKDVWEVEIFVRLECPERRLVNWRSISYWSSRINAKKLWPTPHLKRQTGKRGGGANYGDFLTIISRLFFKRAAPLTAD